MTDVQLDPLLRTVLRQTHGTLPGVGQLAPLQTVPTELGERGQGEVSMTGQYLGRAVNVSDQSLSLL